MCVTVKGSGIIVCTVPLCCVLAFPNICRCGGLTDLQSWQRLKAHVALIPMKSCFFFPWRYSTAIPGEKIAKIFRVDCLCHTIFLLKVSLQRRYDDLLPVQLNECFIDGRMKKKWGPAWSLLYNKVLKNCFQLLKFKYISCLTVPSILSYRKCNTVQLSYFLTAHFIM